MLAHCNLVVAAGLQDGLTHHAFQCCQINPLVFPYQYRQQQSTDSFCTHFRYN